MENIITFIIFLIVIGSVIKNIKSAMNAGQSKKTDPTSSKSKPEGLGQLLGKLVVQIKEEIEKGQATNSGTKQWDALTTPAQSSESELQPPPELSRPRPQAAAKTRSLPAKQAPQTSKSKSNSTGSVSLASPPKGEVTETLPSPISAVPRIKRRRFNRLKLRKAIIWSEIIGPPAAMKQLDRHHLQ